MYLTKDFLHAMMLIPLSFVLSFVIAWLLKETGRKQAYEHLS